MCAIIRLSGVNLGLDADNLLFREVLSMITVSDGYCYH